MAKYFGEQKWSEAIKYNDWYLRLADDYKKLTKQQVFYAYHWIVLMSGEAKQLLSDNETG